MLLSAVFSRLVFARLDSGWASTQINPSSFEPTTARYNLFSPRKLQLYYGTLDPNACARWLHLWIGH